MKDGFGSRRRVESPAAIKHLRNPRMLRMLGAFMTRPALLGDVSARLEIPPNSAWRMAMALVACGLLRVSHTEKRNGRALKWYVAVAPMLFVPYEAEGERLPDEVVRRVVEMRVEEQVRGLVAAAGVTLQRSGVSSWGTLIYADRYGHLVVRPDFEAARTPDLLGIEGPAYLNVYLDDLRLSQADAKRLQADLVALLKTYKSCDGPQAFTLSTVLAPRVGGRNSRRTR